MKFESSLNKPQLDAVISTDGPMLILAGAGSGKTRVITYRIANLIKNHSVPPFYIMAVTFTNKAAAEMKERIANLIGPAGEQVFVKTFHSACVYILRRYGSEIGIPSNFSIYDSKDQETVVKEILLDMNLDPKKLRPSSLVSKISEIKDKAELSDNSSDLFPDHYPFDFQKLYNSYCESLETKNALDFNDLLIKTVKLLQESPTTLSTLQNKWQYVLIDEYQDTNKAQYLLSKLLAEGHKNICVVGDDDQSIYSWRGADIRNILDFEKDYPDAKVIKLEENYRSTSLILDTAHCIIKNNLERKDKKLFSSRGEGELPVFCSANNEYGEAEFVINQIADLKSKNNLKNADFSIFYRTNAQSRVFEDRLRKSKIAYKIVGGLKFYDRKEIKDIIAYLKFIVNPSDTVSLFRIINTPARGIGNKTIEKIKDSAYENSISEWEVIDKNLIPGAKTPKGIIEFSNIFKSFFEKNSQIPISFKLSDLVKEVINKSGYKKSLENEDSIESKSRLENINEFLNSVYEYETHNDNHSLEEFLQEISLMTSEENPGSDEDLSDPTNRITLMTVHNAKGLEFPVVFLTGMEEGTFPHFNASDTEEGIEEERRLAYVGITRAMNHIFISCAEFRRSFNSVSYKEVSRFINEIDPDLLKKIEYAEKSSYSASGQNFKTHTRKSNSSYFSAGSVSSEAKNFFNNLQSDESKTTSDNPDSEFKIKDRISHPKYGNGYILTIEGKGDNVKLTINFNTVGIKTFMEKYTPLEKIQ